MPRSSCSVLWWFRTPDATVSLNRYAPGSDVGVHRHACDQTCILLAGSYDACFAGTRVPCTEGNAVFHPAGADHSDHLSDEPCLSLRVEWSAHDSTREPARRRPGMRSTARLLRSAMKLTQPAPDRPIDVDRWEELRSELRDEFPTPSDGAETAPAWFARAHNFVVEHYRDGIGLHDVAAFAKRGRTQVAAGFRAHLGVSVGQLVHQLQVETAERLMQDASIGLDHIAAAAGFSDQPHLNRVFSRARGIPPGKWRQRGRRLTQPS